MSCSEARLAPVASRAELGCEGVLVIEKQTVFASPKVQVQADAQVAGNPCSSRRAASPRGSRNPQCSRSPRTPVPARLGNPEDHLEIPRPQAIPLQLGSRLWGFRHSGDSVPAAPGVWHGKMQGSSCSRSALSHFIAWFNCRRKPGFEECSLDRNILSASAKLFFDGPYAVADLEPMSQKQPIRVSDAPGVLHRARPAGYEEIDVGRRVGVRRGRHRPRRQGGSWRGNAPPATTW